MKSVSRIAMAAALALTVAACAGDDGRRDTTANPNTGAVGTAGITGGDRDFLDEQIAMGEAEIELGRLAQERGTHADVKEFGEMMVRDHRAAGDQLKAIAQKANVQTSRSTDAHKDHNEFREDLAKLSGRDFDRRYIDRMVEDHEEAVKDLEDKAEKSDHTDVKQWASSTLPKVRQHLERAKSIKETLNNTGM
jgi:putative membrane protein